MKIYDLSITVTDQTVTWHNSETGLTVRPVSTIGEKSPANVSVLTVGAHLGTHLDAPRHFVADGGTVETIAIERLVGWMDLVEIYDRAAIEADDLDSAGIPADCKRLLIRTNNTRRRLIDDTTFHTDYVGLAPSAAHWIVDRGILLVGLDYLSVGAYGPGNGEVHVVLLSQSVVLVETLDLEDVPVGRYRGAILPLKLTGAEATPCRAVLMKED
jgi:arylformamidase